MTTNIKTPLFIGFGIERNTRRLGLICCNKEEGAANADLAERVAQKTEGFDAAFSRVFDIGDIPRFGEQFTLWLAENDIVGADNSDIVKAAMLALQDFITRAMRRKMGTTE